jgi:hypothetical protein
VSLKAIPADLRERPQWVLWRYEERDCKRTKAPWQARHPERRASSTDSNTWATIEEAVAAEDQADGLGFVFSAEDPFFGVDLDGELSEGDKGAILLMLDSYSEHSVSGTGYHVIGRGKLPDGSRNRRGPIEIYDSGRFFVMTGAHVRGTSETIEERQAELEEVIAHFLPANEEARASSPPQPVDVEDEDLLDRARRARNGADFERLWTGDTSAYPSHSEADLALCSHLAFWTGRDPERIDRMFRASGLYREKWERGDYRTATIEEALAGCRDVYTPQRDLAANRQSSADLPEPLLSLHAMPIDDFAGIDEPSAEPLLGDERDTILSAGGALVFYGDGGAGKTTLEIDVIFHLAAGLDWLDLPVPRPVKILVIENEGPRGKFRVKLRKKLAGWEGPPVEERIHVLEEPWALFTFADERHREALRALIVEHEIDVVAAGPVQRLGMQGGGTPDEVGAFMLNIELTRTRLERPVAVLLAHHENKAGQVAGAWEGVPDTLAHVQAIGNGATRLFWRKVRWGSTLHGKTWKLLWRDGEGFEVDETPERTEDDIAEAMTAVVRARPGASWNAVETAVEGKASRKRSVRDLLLEEGSLVNVGGGHRFELYAADDPVLEQLRPEGDAVGTHSASDTESAGESANASRVPPYKGTQGRGRTFEDPDAELAWR